MFWKGQQSHSNGPWGQDPGDEPKNPWGNRNQNKSQTPGPDLESLIRKIQDQLKSFFPGGGNSNNIHFVWIALIVAFGLWMSTGFYYVSEGRVGIEQRFGKYSGTTEPGLRYHLPAPLESVTVLWISEVNQTMSGIQVKSDKALMNEESSNLMLTGDENILHMKFSVLWFIKDPVKYLFSDPTPQQTVKLSAESAVREVIAQTKFADALTKGKNKISMDSKNLLQKMMDTYGNGIEIQQILLEQPNPPAKVIDSHRDVQSARADLERKRNEAQAYENSIIPEARGQAEQLTQNAEAYRQSEIADAQGQSERFLSVLKEYKAAPDITKRRIYIDSMSKILKNGNKIIIDGNNIQNVLPYLPLPSLETKKASEPSQP